MGRWGSRLAPGRSAPSLAYGPIDFGPRHFFPLLASFIPGPFYALAARMTPIPLNSKPPGRPGTAQIQAGSPDRGRVGWPELARFRPRDVDALPMAIAAEGSGAALFSDAADRVVAVSLGGHDPDLAAVALALLAVILGSAVFRVGGEVHFLRGTLPLTIRGGRLKPHRPQRDSGTD